MRTGDCITEPVRRQVVAPDIYCVRMKAIYWLFLRRMGIDPQTGDLPTSLSSDRKLATYPYIGSRYGTDPEVKRLLVVGLEVAHDERIERGIMSLEQRRRTIECKPVAGHNPHIAGTYFTALKYACPQHGWDRFAHSDKTCKALLKAGRNLLERNPLSYIALTNFYKWVTKGAVKTDGPRDRKNFRPDLEIQLFLDEVRVLDPDIVVFQSAEYGKSRFQDVRKRVRDMAGEYHVLEHPSRRGRRRPKDITLPRQNSTASG